MISIRPATPRDDLRIFRMRNDPFIYEAGFSQKPVSLDEHLAWYKNALKESSIFLIEMHDTKEDHTFCIGVLRFTPNDRYRYLEASIYMLKKHCGKGYGPIAIKLGCQAVQERWGVWTIKARFLNSNLRSRRAFFKAGFVRAHGDIMEWKA